MIYVVKKMKHVIKARPHCNEGTIYFVWMAMAILQ